MPSVGKDGLGHVSPGLLLYWELSPRPLSGRNSWSACRACRIWFGNSDFVAFVLNNEIHWFCRRHSRKSPGKQKQYPENCHWIDWIKPQGRVSLGLLQRGVFCYYGILANYHGCMLLLVVEWRWLSRFPAKMTLVHAAHNFVLRNLVLVVVFVLESKALTDRITPPLNARLFHK